MKKALSLLLIFLLCMAMTACSKDKEPNEPKEVVNPVNVTISIVDSENDELVVEDFTPIENASFIVEEGTNVLEATQLYCVANDIDFTLNSANEYVTSMMGVGEKDIESTTGWTFNVNGESPVVSANEVVVNEGDEICWEFIDFTTYSW